MLPADLAIRRPADARAGVPLGIALALAPKPLLIPVLIWMLVWRRRALAALTATAAVTVTAGLLVMGPEIYSKWIDVLAHAGSITRQGNLSIWSGGVQAGSLVLGIGVAGITLVAISRDKTGGFVAALFAGLLLAPYTLLYSASILVLAVAPGLRISPIATKILTLVANPVMLAAFAAWCVAGLASVIAFMRGSAPGGRRSASGI